MVMDMKPGAGGPPVAVLVWWFLVLADHQKYMGCLLKLHIAGPNLDLLNENL